MLDKTQELLIALNQAREEANASVRHYESILEKTRLDLSAGETQIRQLKSEGDAKTSSLRGEILHMQHEFMQMRENLRAELSGQPYKAGFGHKGTPEESVVTSEDSESPGESGNL